MIVVLTVLLTCASLAQAPAPPQPAQDIMATLKALVREEARLVQAARQFDLAETALAEAEREQANLDAKAGEAAKALEKRKQAAARFARIREAWEFVLQQYGGNAHALAYYGELLYDRFGDIAGALRAWQLANALDPKLSTPLNDLAIHYCHAGDYARGLKAYDEAIALDPDNPDYLFNVAQAYLIHFPEVQEIRKWSKTKVYREAMKLSKKAAKLAPKDFELVQDYAVNFFAAENFGVKVRWREAAEVWRQVRALARTPDETFYTWLNEARVWILAKRKPESSVCLREALKLCPENPVAQKLLQDLERPAAKGSAR